MGAFTVVFSSAHAQSHYTLSILPVDGTCISMNNVGQILGYGPRGPVTPFIFEGGTEHDIKDLYCNPLQIDDAGQFIADDTPKTGGLFPIVRNANGSISKIPYLKGTTQFDLWEINASGTVVGRDYNSNGSVSLGFVYRNGKTSALPVIQGHTFVSAHCINTQGQIVAVYRLNNDPNQRRAAIVTGTQMQDLGTYPSATDIQPFGMNDNDEVVGIGTDGTTPSAFLYTGGKMQSVGQWVPVAINNSSQVIGYEIGTQIDTAVLYAHGTLTDLNTLIDPLDSKIHVFLPLAINNSGQILAWCTVNGNNLDIQNCLLTPR